MLLIIVACPFYLSLTLAHYFQSNSLTHGRTDSLKHSQDGWYLQRIRATLAVVTQTESECVLYNSRSAVSLAKPVRRYIAYTDVEVVVVHLGYYTPEARFGRSCHSCLERVRWQQL